MAAPSSSPRERALGTVLEGVVTLARAVSGSPHPFDGIRLSRSQVDALYLLAHASGEVTSGRLATALGLTPGAVTQLVDRLRSLGLAQSAPRPGDARVRVVTLTADAQRRIGAFELGIVRTVAPRFADLDDDDVATLGRLLGRVRATS